MTGTKKKKKFGKNGKELEKSYILIQYKGTGK